MRKFFELQNKHTPSWSFCLCASKRCARAPTYQLHVSPFQHQFFLSCKKTRGTHIIKMVISITMTLT